MPILTDHSAFDAYMLLVEGAGRRIFQSGGFRRHERNAGLVEALMARPRREIDVLICERTNLSTDKVVMNRNRVGCGATCTTADVPSSS